MSACVVCVCAAFCAHMNISFFSNDFLFMLFIHAVILLSAASFHLAREQIKNKKKTERKCCCSGYFSAEWLEMFGLNSIEL